MHPHAMAAATPAAAGFITITVAVVSLGLPLPCLCQLPPSGSYYYNSCVPSTCGGVNISFPFTSSDTFCGLPGYKVSCSLATPTIALSGRSYQVINIFPTECLITVSDPKIAADLRSGDCGSVRGRGPPAANFAPLELPPWWVNVSITSFVCPTGSRQPANIDPVVVNYTGCVGKDLLYYYPLTNVGANKTAAPCTSVSLPVGGAAVAQVTNLSESGDFLGVLEGGFPLLWQNQTACWDCEAAGGRCGYNHSTEQVVCFHCKEGCGGGGGGRAKKFPWKIVTATGIPGVLLMLMLVASLIKYRERALPFFTSNLCNRSHSSHDSVDVQEFIKTYRSSLVSEYSYLHIKKMTEGFKEKLGEGGCGAVYKGRLFNGQPVAVKMLEKSDNSGQDFVNEVATIGRIHHVNIIRLMGFCYDGYGSHMALIYEFMPNGSLGDFLSKHGLVKQHLGLGGAGLLNIAVGVARGIEYLHQGCDTRILHLDIKPHNVLLDTNLNPKISDFGLAKLYSRRDNSVSLTGARGTIGYIAPELFMSNVGAVSDRSDVYSYGMLLLEMAVGRSRIRAVEVTGDSSRFYFPHWVYDQLEQWREMEVLRGSAEEEDPSTARKMVMVGLWCIQTDPADRPSITRVLEMLTGRVGGIDLPPKPVLFSMPRELHRGASSDVDGHGDTLFYTVQSSWR